MKLLPDSFAKKGFQFRLEFREQNVAIYKRYKNPETPHWEVIIVREQKERAMSTPLGAVVLPHSELYPSSEQWGRYGWTYTDYPDARRKADSLLV